MDFIVEDGTGLEDSTSYVTVEEATDYINIRTRGSSWDDLEESDKEELLMWSSQLLDQRVLWKGRKTVDESNLRWPRTGVLDRDGLLIPYDVIPKQLKEAVSELTAYLLANAIDAAQPSLSGSSELERIKVDVIELVYKASQIAQASNVNPIPPHLARILYPIGILPGMGGNNFVKILKT